MANYIGKIAAVGTINMSQIASGLNASARDVEKYARSVRSTITSANTAAGRSFQEIFTPLQRLERALQASQNRTLRVDVGGGAERIRAIVGAAEDIARPLAASQKQFSTLAATVQNEFIGSLVRAQNAAKLAENAINRGQITNAAGYERLKRIVDSVTESQRRLAEASTATSGLATGRELRFQQADFASELQRASALQSQASALPADARRSGAVGQLVELQRREAEEAARLLSVLENVRNTRRGDAAAAQANLDAQVRLLGEVNGQLERQVRLSSEATRAFTLSQAPRQQRGLGLFGSQAGTEEEQALARARALSAEFSRLPEAAQSGLQGLAGIASRVSDAVQSGTSNATQLNAVLDRLSSGVQSAASAAGQQELGRRIGNGFLNVITVAEAQADTIEARQQELGRRIGNGFLTIVTAEEAAADTIEARQQELGRRIGSGLLRVLSLAEAAADTPFSVDQRRRREAGSSLLQVIPLPRDEIRDRLGPDIASAAAEFSRLEAATVSVRSQIENLPAPIRAQFIPALRDAVEELVRLQTTNAGADEIARATQRVNELRAGVTRADRAFQAFGGNFRDFADGADFQGAAGRLQFLRQQLLRATGDTTRAEQAVDELAAAFREAASAPGGFRRFAGQLNQIEREAVEAAAAVLRINPQRLAEQLRRAGDVSRGGFGNVQLAVQQAAFAVDDFFSVTGDLSQRIRAAGNNISQLAFILGGTRGLIIGVAASIGAQLVTALVNWANSGRTAEAQTRALNDALSRQRSLASELAAAFDTLGQRIVSRGFSPAAAAANELADQLREISRLQDQVAESALSATSRGVQNARTDQSVIRGRLEAETDLGRRIALTRQLAEAQRVEREAARRFAEGAATPLRQNRGIFAENFALENAPIAGRVPTGREVAVFLDRVANAAEARGRGRTGIGGTVDALSGTSALTAGSVLGFGATAPEFLAAARQLRAFSQELDLGNSAEAISAQADAIQEAIELFKGVTTRTFAGFATDAANEAAAFTAAFSELRERILVGFNRQTDRAITDSLSTASRATSILDQAQRSIAESVGRGVRGADVLSADIDRLSQSVRRSVDTINQVIQGVDAQGNQVERTPGQSRQVIDREQARLRRLLLEADDGLQAAIVGGLGRTIGGDRATAALQSLRGNQSFATEYAGLVATLESAVAREAAARDAFSRSSNDQTIASLQAAAAASEFAAAAAEAAIAVDSGFAALRQSLDGVAQASQQAAQDAQRRLNEAGLTGRPIADLRRERDVAEANLLSDRSRIGQLQARLTFDRDRAIRSPEVQRINAAIEATRAAREESAARARQAGQPADIRQALILGQRQLELENRRSAVIARLTAATRAAIEAEIRAVTARERRTAFLRGVQEELNPVGDPTAGLNLLRTPAERAAIELNRQFANIQEAVNNLRGVVPENVLQERQRDARQQVVADAIRQQAPLLAQFSDEVFNALLQGPSRAALQATDASTLEGQRELNRLLRGDDPARDVNLLELQRQTAELEKLVELAQNGPQVAN